MQFVFLTCLNVIFFMVKSQILFMDQFSCMNKIFFVVLQYKSEENFAPSKDYKALVNAFYSQRSKGKSYRSGPSSKDRNRMCTHRGKTNDTVDNCSDIFVKPTIGRCETGSSNTRLHNMLSGMIPFSRRIALGSNVGGDVYAVCNHVWRES